MKSEAIFDRSQGIIFIVITLNQGFFSMCRKKELFQTPLRYIDLVRRTNTTSDVLLESRIGDKWNVDGTQLTILSENLETDTRGPGGG